MSGDFISVIEKAILLELNAAQLYLLFYRLFPSDSTFWWELSIEEQNHAALLKTVRKMNESHVPIPEEFYPEGIYSLDESNQMITRAIQEFEENPDRKRAFQVAYEIENSAGELHYDSFVKSTESSPFAVIFKRLNRDDIDHAKRIRQYMAQKGL